MMLAGDEFAHSQFGNNNPYCQDNVLTWIAWDAISKEDKEQVKFVRRVIGLRKKLRIFNRRHFFIGKVVKNGYKDIAWYNERGVEMAANDWHDGNRKALSYCVYTGSRFVLAIFNANHDDMSWKLPEISGQSVLEFIAGQLLKIRRGGENRLGADNQSPGVERVII